MPRHSSEMRRFMRLTENMHEDHEVAVSLDDSVDELFQEDRAALLLRELADLRFKLESYRELNEDQQFALGVEQGHIKAADMLGRLLDKYSDLSV